MPEVTTTTSAASCACSTRTLRSLLPEAEIGGFCCCSAIQVWNRNGESQVNVLRQSLKLRKLPARILGDGCCTTTADLRRFGVALLTVPV